MPTRAFAIFLGTAAFAIAAYFLLSGSKKIESGASLSLKHEVIQAKTLQDQKPNEVDQVLERAEKSYESTKLSLVREIINSRNDNDPRMDTELKVLDENTKKQLIELYHSRAPEDLNGRGTIVFLLGRNIRNPDDFKFFQEVISESPCLSLRDCSTLPEESEFEDRHDDGAEQVSLSYPKHVVLSSFERAIREKRISRDMRDELFTALELARRTPEQPVARRAENILSRIRRN